MTAIAPPPPAAVAPLPPLELLRAGQCIPVAWGYSTVLPDWDVETYSEAGFIWDEVSQKFKPPIGATKKGLPAVGSSVYFEHPTADIICMAYDLKDGRGRRRWKPGQPNPQDLIDYLLTYDDTQPPSYSQPGLIESHNSGFEIRCAIHVLHKKYNWPLFNIRQMRCSMAKARAFSLPGKLENLATVLKTAPKNPNGDKLIRLFSCPQNPTTKRAAGRVWPEQEPQKAEDYSQYNEDDIIAEAAASARIPDLIPQELQYWLADQACNWRGVGVDRESVAGCLQVLQQAHRKYNAELYQVTGGAIAKASEATAIGNYVFERTGLRMMSKGKHSVDSDAVEAALEDPRIPPHPEGGLDPVRRVLEIRALIGSAAVKKVYSMARMATADNRACDMHVYHGARTGRDTHQDLQTGNMAKSGPNIRWCDDVGCNRPYAHGNHACPWCGADSAFSREKFDKDSDKGWTWQAADPALEIMRYGNLELVEYFFGDAVLTISGCVRSLLVAAPGHDLLCSDYSAIEAVVLAVLAGEQWRIDAFHRGESIYYHGAAGVTGKSYQFYADYKRDNGHEHPDRSKIGKVAELALGFMGWIKAWRNFDKSDNFSDEQVKEIILKWQAASPMLKECAGGQVRGNPWRPTKFENYGYEGMFLNAIQNPGETFSYRGIDFTVTNDIMFVKLPSGRRLTYHSPRAERHERFKGVSTFRLSYMGWNTSDKRGPKGWSRMDAYCGNLEENIVQAVARDLMSAAVVRLEAAGYPVVMRVHDEIVSEVPEGYGSAEEFEALMAQLPDWAAGWPVRCGGTYREKRYKK
jgi:DNA polymerase